MFNSLRFRLIVSYIAIVVVCLAIMAVTLALLIRGNPLSRGLTQERLLVTMANVTRLVQSDLRANMTPEQAMADLRSRYDTQETRVLFFVGANKRIVVDSSGTLEGRGLDELTRGTSVRLSDGLLTGFINLGDAQPWIYIARSGVGIRNIGILVAQSPQASNPRSPIYAQVLGQLALAGCLGGLLSVLAALLIAESVSRPLRRLTQAASAIAQGDYDQTVPVQGPTEVRELAANFNAMAAQVRSSQQSQRDFLANVSHDLKTPLTSIQGFAQAIVDGAAGDAEGVRRSAAVIQDEAQRMARMVAELLDLARIESGQVIMRREPIHVDAVLRDCAAKLALSAQQAGVVLDTQILTDLPLITGDGDRLAQAFTNLIDNALKHTPEGGRVTVAARSLSGSSIVRRGKTGPAGVEVSVSDTGSGIPPQELDRIFERFYQVDKSRQRGGGLGLGLAIVKQIVEAHHGTITVESAVGRGSRFIVMLPLDSGTDVTQARRMR